MVKHEAKWYESTAAEPEGLGRAKVAHKEWQAIVEDWRKVPAGKGDKSVIAGRVRSDDKGKAGRKESGQAVREATQEHSSEDGEI